MKKLLAITLLVTLTSCGTIFNNKKPTIENIYEKNRAVELGIIERTYKYMLGNGILLLIPIVGTIPAAISLVLDEYNGANYQIVDQEKYKKFKDVYRKKQEEDRANFLSK